MTFTPKTYKGTDSQKLQAAIDAWVKNPGAVLDLSDWTGLLDKPVFARPVYDRINGIVKGNPMWHSIEYTGTGPAITFESLKGAQVFSLSIRCSDPNGSGVLCTTSGSSSAVTFYDYQFHCPDKGLGYGFRAEGLNGADVSGYTLYSPLFEGAGMVFAGSNNLDPHIVNARTSFCKIGCDLRNGGSLAVLDHIGGSYNDEIVVVNGGYPVDIRNAWGELSGTLVRLGGDDAAGYGQTTNADISVADWRSPTGTMVKVNKAGTVTLAVRSAYAPTLKVENRNTVRGKVLVSGVPVVAFVTGPTDVTGSVLQTT